MSVEISVIVPFYKTEPIKLRICIESLLKQSFKDFELLLVDDGNDEKYDLLKKEYEEKDARVHFIAQQQSGVSAARNYGIEKSSGKYIVFCDSDDYVDSGYLYSLYEAIQDSDLAICGVKGQHFPSIDSITDRRVFFSIPSQYNWIQYTNFSVNKIFKSEIIKENKLAFDSDIRLGEDALFLNQYFKYCKRIRCISENLYTYVVEQTSAVHTYYENYWDWEKQVICSQYEMFTQYPLSSMEKMFMDYWMYVKLKGSMYYYISNQSKWTAEKTEEQRLKDIFESSFMQEILNSNRKANIYFCRKDRIILNAWKMMGLRGVKVMYKATMLKKRMR